MNRDGGFSDPPSVQTPAYDDRGIRLESWKEIADYLCRGVTTVQRWEHEEALPVHRHDHAKKGSVYSYTRELDEWRARRERTSPAAPDPTPSADAEGLTDVYRLGAHRLATTAAGILALTVAVVIGLWLWPWHRVRADASRWSIASCPASLLRSSSCRSKLGSACASPLHRSDGGETPSARFRQTVGCSRSFDFRRPAPPTCTSRRRTVVSLAG